MHLPSLSNPLGYTSSVISSIHCPSYQSLISSTSYPISKPSTIVQEWVTPSIQSPPSTILQELITPSVQPPINTTLVHAPSSSTILQDFITPSVQSPINTTLVHEWVTPSSSTMLQDFITPSAQPPINTTFVHEWVTPLASSTFHSSINNTTWISSHSLLNNITLTPFSKPTFYYTTPTVYSSSSIIFNTAPLPTYTITPLVNSPSSILINTTSLNWIPNNTTLPLTSIGMDCTQIRNWTSNSKDFINTTATIPLTTPPWTVTTSDGLRVPIGYRCYLLIYLIWSLFFLY